MALTNISRRFFSLWLFVSAYVYAYSVEDFCVQYQGDEYHVIRSFETRYLAVNVASLQTSTFAMPMKPIKCDSASSYEKLKQQALRYQHRMANAGITQGGAKGYSITIDMCPSSKQGFETVLFEYLRHHHYPFTISITKKWIDKHPIEFSKLKAMQQTNSITWMNHSTTHPYDKKVSIESNFLNSVGVDFDAEIVGVENVLLQEGITPSIFFRFPGLISSPDKVQRLVKHYGLIPIGSRAWIAKKEPIRPGSIVLIHGNKNEPLGIKWFLQTNSKLPVLQLTQNLKGE